jgi:hypothetical protein
MGDSAGADFGAAKVAARAIVAVRGRPSTGNEEPSRVVMRPLLSDARDAVAFPEA